MTTMNRGAESQVGGRPSRRNAYVAVFFLIVLASAYLRFGDLGARSLWRDELCTWHVSRMAPVESLRWGPELSKPPLYQFALRLTTGDPHPTESQLRFPAALCGVLTVLAGGWLGFIAGRWPVAVAMAGLLAFNGLQIEYSQEARPYSMMVLGCTLATALWYRVVLDRRWLYLVAYVVVAVLTVHAHYLAGLTIAAHAVWWIVRTIRQDSDQRSYRPLVALIAIDLLCTPIALRYLHYQASMFQGLEWIQPPTWSSTWHVLERLTFNWQWIVGLLIPGMLLWLASASNVPLVSQRRRQMLFPARDDICGLLLLCFLIGWGGLLVISWMAHPAMVARYALPAAVGAMLFPLTIAGRLDGRAPLVIAAAFVVGAAPGWVSREYDPGLRELAAYVSEHANAETEAVVLTMDETIYPGWEDSERLAFEYYPIDDVPVEELRLEADGVTASNDILRDPRGLYLVVLWADPFPILEAAGRTPIPIQHEGRSYTQLLFTPYRLVHVAPIK